MRGRPGAGQGRDGVAVDCGNGDFGVVVGDGVEGGNGGVGSDGGVVGGGADGCIHGVLHEGGE